MQDPSVPRTEVISIEDRFWSKVRKRPGGCWLWIAGTDPTGYGRFSYRGRGYVAHRVAYEWLVGPIPDGLVLDHLCGVPGCVNPDHLDPVTLGENTRRGTAPSAVAQRTNRCKRGHTLADAAVATRRDGRKYRTCIHCRRMRQRLRVR